MSGYKEGASPPSRLSSQLLTTLRISAPYTPTHNGQVLEFTSRIQQSPEEKLDSQYQSFEGLAAAGVEAKGGVETPEGKDIGRQRGWNLHEC